MSEIASTNWQCDSQVEAGMEALEEENFLRENRRFINCDSVSVSFPKTDVYEGEGDGVRNTISYLRFGITITL